MTLAEIKADARFKEFPLTYLPRLSVMPVTQTRSGTRSQAETRIKFEASKLEARSDRASLPRLSF